MNGTINDHDLLIKVATILDVVKDDVRELKAVVKSTNDKLDAELSGRATKCLERYNECESKYISRKEVKTTATITGGIVSAVVAILVWVGRVIFGVG